MERQITEKVEFNLFDEDTVMLSKGYTKESDGSFYTSRSQPRTGIYFENTEGYTGQIYCTFTRKDGGTSGRGISFQFEYTDGTKSDVSANDQRTTTFRTLGGISKVNKVVKRITATYGSNVPCWLKDICININQPDTSISPHNGDYVPFQQTKNYVVLETCGQVDLSTLDWHYNTTYANPMFYATVTGMKLSAKIECPIYTPISSTGRVNFGNNANDLEIASRGSTITEVMIRNDAYKSISAFKQAMQGVILTYELANPKPHAIKNVITI